jgi:hypothetical protein
MRSTRLAVLLALIPLVPRATPTDFLPPSGPYGTVATPFVPAVPGAAEAAAAAYLRADGRRLGALLAAVPAAGYDPAAALAAFAGGTPGAVRPVLLRGRPFALSTVARRDGAAVYAVAFAVTRAAGRVVVDPARGDVHVVAWAEAEEAAAALALAVLDHLAGSSPLAFAQDAADVLALSAAPNPFTGSTTLRFTLPAAADVEVVVLDLLGRRVAVATPGRLDAGPHALPFEAETLASGVYLVRLAAGAAVTTLRLSVR